MLPIQLKIQRKKLLISAFLILFAWTVFFSAVLGIRQVGAASHLWEPGRNYLGVGQNAFIGVSNPETCKSAQASNLSNPPAGGFVTQSSLDNGNIAPNFQGVTTNSGNLFLNSTVFPKDRGTIFIAQGATLAGNSSFIAGPECLNEGVNSVTYLDSATVTCNGGASVQTIPANLVNGKADFPIPSGSESCQITYNFLLYQPENNCASSGTCPPLVSNVCPVNPYSVSLNDGNANDPATKGHIVIYRGDAGSAGYKIYRNGAGGYNITILGCLPGSSCSGSSGSFFKASDEFPADHATNIQTGSGTPLGDYLQNVLIEDVGNPGCRVTANTLVTVKPSRKSVCDGTWRAIPPAPVPYQAFSNPVALFNNGASNFDKYIKATYDGQHLSSTCSAWVSSTRQKRCDYLNGISDTCTWDMPPAMEYTVGFPASCPPPVYGWGANSGSIGAGSSATDAAGRTYEVRRVIPYPPLPSENNSMEYKCSSPVITLSVSLTADPNSGSSPLNSDLDADVSGTATGTINYSFWWNCTDTSTSVATVTTACGSLPVPSSGSCASNANGYKCLATNDDEEEVSHVYTSSSTAKVIVERGTALPAEARATVTITNSPPTASNAIITQPDYCTTGPSAFVGWTYSDPNGNPQSAYQVQVDDQGSFNSPEVDSGKILNSGTSYFTGNGVPPWAWDITYRARVRVWDSLDAVSGWTTSSTWKTPKHAYPLVNFIWVPLLNPSANQLIQFTDQTTFYDTSGVGQRGWSWLFKAPAGSPNSTLQNPTYTYAANGTYSVSDTVTDKDGYVCSLTKPINIDRPIPVWKEVSPR